MELLVLAVVVFVVFLFVAKSSGSDQSQAADPLRSPAPRPPTPRPGARFPPPKQAARVRRRQYKVPEIVPPRPSGLSVLKGKCWVIDGDTIVIDKVHIRLFGIDAPELDHPYGKQAKWAMVKLCKGQVITATLHNRQSHDRVVATCRLPDGRDLSEELVKMGLAIDWPKYSDGVYRRFELEGIRKKLWRCDARQRGRMLS